LKSATIIVAVHNDVGDELIRTECHDTADAIRASVAGMFALIETRNGDRVVITGRATRHNWETR
jgi:hypothetical protein